MKNWNMAPLSKVKWEIWIKMQFINSKTNAHCCQDIHILRLVSHQVAYKSSCLSRLCEVGYQTRYSRHQIRQARNPVGAFCLSSENLLKTSCQTYCLLIPFCNYAEINLAEKKNCQPRAGYNYDPPICDLSILQVLIDFDTPFCSVKIVSECNTLSASGSNSSSWDVQTCRCLARSAWGFCASDTKTEIEKHI